MLPKKEGIMILPTVVVPAVKMCDGAVMETPGEDDGCSLKVMKVGVLALLVVVMVTLALEEMR